MRQSNIGVDVSRTPSQLLNIFRFPSGNERELARAGEIYHRYAADAPQVSGRFSTGTREMYHRYAGDLPQVRGRCTTGTREMHHRYAGGAPQVCGRYTTGTREMHHRYAADLPQVRGRFATGTMRFTTGTMRFTTGTMRFTTGTMRFTTGTMRFTTGKLCRFTTGTRLIYHRYAADIPQVHSRLALVYGRFITDMWEFYHIYNLNLPRTTVKKEIFAKDT
jgi:hypothetical protein